MDQKASVVFHVPVSAASSRRSADIPQCAEDLDLIRRDMLFIIVRLLIVGLTQKRSKFYNFDIFYVMNIKPDAAVRMALSSSLSLKCHMK